MIHETEYRCIVKQTIKMDIALTQEHINNLPYIHRYPRTEFIILPIDKILEDYYEIEPRGKIRRGRDEKTEIRIDNCKKFILDAVNRINSEPVTAPIIMIDYLGRLNIEDGRRRLVALKELGVNDAVFEVSRTQLKELFEQYSRAIK